MDIIVLLFKPKSKMAWNMIKKMIVYSAMSPLSLGNNFPSRFVCGSCLYAMSYAMWLFYGGINKRRGNKKKTKSEKDQKLNLNINNAFL